MEFEKNKRSKRQSVTVLPFSQNQLPVPQLVQIAPAWREESSSQERDEMELEERMDKFYTLMGKIKAMKGLWRHGSENNRVKPVLEPVWQPTFSLEDFDGVEEDVREREEKGKGKERMEIERLVKGEDEREEKGSQKEHPNKSEEMEWEKVEENNNGLDLNLSL